MQISESAFNIHQVQFQYPTHPEISGIYISAKNGSKWTPWIESESFGQIVWFLLRLVVECYFSKAVG